MNQPTAETEQLPITTARPMAWLSISMGVGFVLLLYFFFLKGMFRPEQSLTVIAVLLFLSIFSTYVALRNVRKKLICPHCGALFFDSVIQLFAKAKSCGHCNKTV